MRVLGLFAKQPIAGQVKTRLAAETSPEWAARVAEAFLVDALDRLSAVEAERVVVFSPTNAVEYFARLAAGRFETTPQSDGDLGQRMREFLTDRFATGASTVVLVGADSPSLPTTFVEQAFRELERVDVVLGPATDGGYYLLGCRRLASKLFENIAWGTSDVLFQTAAALLDARWSVALLPPWYDVDTLNDWRALRGHLRALRAAGIDPELPHTEQLGNWE